MGQKRNYKGSCETLGGTANFYTLVAKAIRDN